MIPEYSLSGRPKRAARLPKHYQDVMPEPMIPVSMPTIPTESTSVESDAPDSDTADHDDQNSSFQSSEDKLGSIWVQTDPDAFDLYRQYHTSFPTYDPENMTYFGQFCDSPTFVQDDSNAGTQEPWYSGFSSFLKATNDRYFAPFFNGTTYRLMSWFYNSSSTKSLADLDRLVNDVILAEDFNREDLRDFNASYEGRRMDKAQASLESPQLSAADGWHEASLKIPVPCEKVKFPSEADAPKFTVRGLYYQKFTEVIKSAYEEVSAKSFHTQPFKLFWQPDEDQPPECIISELYTADAMLAEDKKIKTAPQVPGCTLETIVAAIMLWSDSTHLANFGNASLWPIYMFIGNLSKYTHAKATSFSAHHLAYIPKVSGV
jgi:hypothetical protein